MSHNCPQSRAMTQRTFDDYLKDIVGEEEANGLAEISAFSDPDEGYERHVEYADEGKMNRSAVNDLSLLSVTPPHPIRVNREGVENHHPDISHAWSDLESKSFVNGLLSPFSPLLTKRINKERREELANYISLQPCMKVSVVVRVVDHQDQNNSKNQKQNDNNDDDHDDDQLCVFPHIKQPLATANGTSVGGTPTQTPDRSSLLGKGAKSSKKSSPRDLIIVKPSAFGKYVPNHVTMETARLVAQVARISSEDWARLYEFHHVIWPSSSINYSDDSATPSKPIDSSKRKTSLLSSSYQPSPAGAGDDGDSFSSFDSIARAVAQDATVEHKSSVLISLGHAPSCIGRPKALACQILAHMTPLLETKAVCRITVMELDEEGNLHDLLKPPADVSSPASPSTPGGDVMDRSDASLQIRHIDSKGAIVQGLVEVSIDSMPSIVRLLDGTKKRRRQSKHQRGRSRRGGSVTTIATISVWRDAVQHELNKLPTCQVTCVELVPGQIASSKQSSTNGTKQKSHITTPDKAIPASTALQKKSVVTLGLTLRQLLLQSVERNIQNSIEGGTIASPITKVGMNTPSRNPKDPQGKIADSFNAGSPTTTITTTSMATSSKMVSFRESTLTKILQRCLEDESSKVVVVASISPLSSQYESTLATLNYVRRLLVAPGRTAASPFRTNRADMTSVTDQSSMMYNYYNVDTGTPVKTINESGDGGRMDPLAALLSGGSDEGEGEALEPPPSPLLQEYGKNEALLKHLVADPRQRLAKIFNMNKPPPKSTDFFGVEIPDLPADLEDEADYQAVDYLKELNLKLLQTTNEKANRRQDEDGEDNMPSHFATGHQADKPGQTTQSIEIETHDTGNLPVEPEFKTPPQSSSLQRYPVTRLIDSFEENVGDYHDQQESGLSGQQWSSPLAKERHGLQTAQSPDRSSGVNHLDHQDSANSEYDNSKYHNAGEEGRGHWHEDAPRGMYEGQEPPGVHVNQEPSDQHDPAAYQMEGSGPDVSQEGVFHMSQPEHEVAYEAGMIGDRDFDDGHTGESHNDDGKVQPDKVVRDSPLKKYFDGAVDHGDQYVDDIENLRSYSLGLEDDDASDLEDLDNLKNDVEDPSSRPVTSEQRVPVEDVEQMDTQDAQNTEVDARNTSHWSEWNSDDEDDDDLDLEPQTNYDLPEAPVQRSSQFPGRGGEDSGGSLYSTHSLSKRESPLVASPDRQSHIPRYQSKVSSTPKASNGVDFEAPAAEGETSPLETDAESDMGKEPEVRESPSLASTVRRSNTSLLSGRASRENYDASDASSGMDNHDGILEGAATSKSSSYDSEGGRLERNRSNLDEVEILEGAVNQIKMIHTDLWESSALSLQRLKNSQKSQQEAVEKAMALRDDAMWELGRIKDENRNIAEAHTEELRRYQDDLQDLQNRLDIALEDKGAVEKIADEAISAQDSLEEKLRGLEEELIDCKRQNESTSSKLTSELNETKLKLARLEEENQAANTRSSKVEITLKQLSEENLQLKEQRKTDRSRIDGLVDEVRQIDLSRKRLEVEKTHLEEIRSEEQSQMEDLKKQSRSFGLSLENLEKERERLKESKREHQSSIEKMEEELRRFRLMVKRLEAERDHLRALHEEDSSKLDGLQKEVDRLRSSREELEKERAHLAHLRQEDQEAIENLEKDSRHVRVKLEKLEAEIESLVKLRGEDRDTIERLRAELEESEQHESERRHFQDEMNLLKKENAEYVDILEKRRLEHFEEVSKYQDEIRRYKLEVDSLKEEIASHQQQGRQDATNAESEIRRLRERLVKFQNEVSDSQRERNEALYKLESIEGRHANQAQSLLEKDLQIERYRSEVAQLGDELADLRGREKAKSSSVERDIRRLEEQVLELQSEVLTARRNAEDATARLEKASFTSETLSGDYERTRTKLARLEANMEQMARELDAAKEDKRRAEEKLANTRTQLDRYQSDAKKRIDSVMNHQREVRREQTTLATENEQLRRRLQQVHRERDLLYRSLENGRDQMAIAVKNRGQAKGDSTVRPVTEVNARTINGDRISHAPTDFYLNEFPAGGDWMSIRTEELVTYLAASAKKTIEETQDEASQLRAKVHNLEAELGRGTSHRPGRRGIDPNRDEYEIDNRVYSGRLSHYR